MRIRLSVWFAACLVLSGCGAWTQWSSRSQSPDDATAKKDAKKEASTKLIGDFAVSYGLTPLRIEAVGLVTGLPGTGSDPAPTPERGALEAEMRTRGVAAPNTVLASKNVSLVMVRAYLRPGVQKGDRFDVELRVPSRSETTSLAGGFLLETRLQEMAVLGEQVRTGNLLALAQGPVLVDPSAEGSKDRVNQCRGRVLGGGVALKSRPMGLVLKPQHQSAFEAARIATAVNKRFHLMQKGLQVGVAKAKTDQLVELNLHPRYKHNIDRYVEVVRSIALRETPAEQVTRIARLKKELADPNKGYKAAWQLEAIGRDGIEALREGLKLENSEVRFYAAEALAYLDQNEAAQPLGEIARQEPAFRVFALTALSAMNDRAAYEELCSLLKASSAETRYGAFRALWAMNPSDPVVVGDPAIKDFSYHALDVEGPPMIHVTRNRRPEIVVFGKDQRLKTPLSLSAGPHILVTSHSENEVAVSKFKVSEPDQKRIVSNRVDEVIRAIVELGGNYPDVIRALEEAKAGGALLARFEVDALPESGRTFERAVAADGPAGATDKTAKDKSAKDKTAKGKSGEGKAGKESVVEKEKPAAIHSTELFSKSDSPPEKPAKSAAKSDEKDKKTSSSKGFFARMMGRADE